MGKIIFTVLFFGLLLTLNTGFAASNSSINNTTSNTNQLTTNTTSTYAAGSTSPINIKVLIYSGTYSAYSCVNGIKTSLISANKNKLVPGYTFTYATSTVINQATLSGYDVLVMPGGSSGYDYLHSSSISGTAIKNFVTSGKGYLGVCAGAYAGSNIVYNYYYGWGLAPHVKCIHPDHEGNLTIQITSTGQKILKAKGILTVAHYNGPAMYVSGNAQIFATYADNIIDSKGLAAIVGDYYGKGRVVLSGPHPELSPQHPSIVANLIVWAANKTSSNGNVLTLSQIGSAAATVKYYYEKNKSLPSSLTIKGYKISMSQFIYLLGRGIVNISKGYTSSINIKNVKDSVPSGTYKSGLIQKSVYINLAKSLISYINTYSKAPNYQITSLGRISFTKLVYMYSKIMNFYRVSKRLPSYVKI